MSGSLSQLNLELVAASQVKDEAAEFALVRDSGVTRLAVAAAAGAHGVLSGFEGDASSGVLVGPLSPRNAAALRSRLEWLRPRPLGTRTSAGLGDRLGLATPGHVRAVRAVGGTVAPIFPPQSIREMARTQRTPTEVMDDATWGVFAEGWREGTGADADHLKTTEDIDATLPVGFTMFTIDPSAHVDSGADGDDLATLRAKVAALPWKELEDGEAALRQRYVGRSFAVEHLKVAFDEAVVLRAAAKYGKLSLIHI